MIKLIRDAEIYDEVFDGIIRPARHSLWIATANVKNMFVQVDRHHTGSFLEVLEDLVNRGVEIRLLHSGVPSGSFIKEIKIRKGLLKSANFTMRKCVRCHFKCVMADGEKMFVGSANLTGAGMGMKGTGRRNFETGLITDEDTLMDGVAGYFDAIWSGDKCEKCGRKKDCAVPLEEPEFER